MDIWENYQLKSTKFQGQYIQNGFQNCKYILQYFLWIKFHKQSEITIFFKTFKDLSIHFYHSSFLRFAWHLHLDWLPPSHRSQFLLQKVVVMLPTTTSNISTFPNIKYMNGVTNVETRITSEKNTSHKKTTHSRLR